ncbi:MAG: T9SS type A sorting domain-containing protein [Bacteroidales bacterium]|nr:T9SS type A sorting domain-containing protein [Bacteroidales bacterium]
MSLRLHLLLLGLLIVNLLTAQNIRLSYTFEQPDFIDRHDGFVEPVMNNCHNLGDEGFPFLPAFSGQILIHQGKEVAEIKIVSVSYSDVISGINIVPAARPFPFSEPAPPDYRPQPKNDIYNSIKSYPGSVISDVSTQYLAGYSIAVFNIWPIEFNPAEKSIRVITSIEIEIETRDTRQDFIQPALQSEVTGRRLASVVSNPEMAKNYIFNSSRDTDQIDMLIITKGTFVTAFTEYANYKTERGFITEIVTTEDIYANYPGSDNQEKIRNCIRDYYENNGIVYVILGGDSDTQNASQRIIPHRGFYVDTGFGTIDEDIPSDMYYSCLDGDWNSNGNNRYGEPGEEDIFAEVIIGRMSIDSNDEVLNMVNKLIKYQDTPVLSDIEKALMVGEALDDNTWGGNYKDEVANGSSNHGYVTVGLSSNFVVSRLYEMNGNWTKQQVYQQFNNTGINLLNHLGHSDVGYNMKMSLSDLTTANLQNNGINRGFVIGYSQGCYNGSFDNRGSGGNYSGSDCFAERITTMETAMVASMSNSRYGWYSQGSTNGPSQIFDRKFFNAIFGKGIAEIGTANGDSKEDAAAFIIANRVNRWCAYEITLFGDPSMSIWTQQPTDITATYPGALPIGISNVTVESDAPGARIGFSQNGVLLGRALADENGYANIEFFDIVSSDDPITISITAHNRTLLTSTIPVLADQPYVVLDYFEINDGSGNNNGVPDYGEELAVGLGMKNLGNVAANDVIVTLSSTDNYITLAYLAVEFGTIGPGETVFIEDAFPVHIANNVPDQHQVQINVQAMGAETWVSSMKFNVNAPALNIQSLTIDDVAGGNGNGMLDPGEMVVFRFDVKNEGHALSPAVTFHLASNNANLTLTMTQANHDGLQPDGIAIFEFLGLVNPDAVMGDLALLQATINSGAYQVTEDYSLKIGMIIEDFESGDFGLINWEFDGELPWTICEISPAQGLYCARSGVVSHEQISEMKVNIFVAATDTISFYRKVSSESGFDMLKFYDGSLLKAQWSGSQDWEKVSYVIYPGYHTLRWVYEKDVAISQGDDCAWVDYIRFPKLLQSTLSAGGDDMVCAGDDYQTKSSGIYLMGIQWTTSGTGTFSNAAILQPVYTPSQEDIQNGSVVLTVSATSANNQPLSDQMTLYMVDNPGTPSKPVGEQEVCTNYGISYEYTTSQLPEIQAFVWELIPPGAGTLTGNSHVISILFTPDYSGDVELRVKAMNACGESAFSESLQIVAQICTGVYEPGSEQISVFPNPSTGLIFARIPDADEILQLSIYNTFGQIVRSESLHVSDDLIEIDLQNYPPGIYLLKLEAKTFSFSKKILLK